MANIITADLNMFLDWASIKAALDSSTQAEKVIVVNDKQEPEGILTRISTSIWLVDIATTPTYVACRTSLTGNISTNVMDGEELQPKTFGFSQVSPEEAYTNAENGGIPVKNA